MLGQTSLQVNKLNLIWASFTSGWSRYDHFASLCELLPVAVPRFSQLIPSINIILIVWDTIFMIVIVAVLMISSIFIWILKYYPVSALLPVFKIIFILMIVIVLMISCNWILEYLFLVNPNPQISFFTREESSNITLSQPSSQSSCSLPRFFPVACVTQVFLCHGTHLGTGPATKTNEFSEYFQRFGGGGGGGSFSFSFMLQILDLYLGFSDVLPKIFTA